MNVATPSLGSSSRLTAWALEPVISERSGHVGDSMRLFPAYHPDRHNAEAAQGAMFFASAAIAPALVASGAFVSGILHYMANPDAGITGAAKSTVTGGMGIGAPLQTILEQQGATGLASTISSHPFISEVVLQGTLGLSPYAAGQRLLKGSLVPTAHELQQAVSSSLGATGMSSADAAVRAEQAVARLMNPARGVVNDLITRFAPDLLTPGAQRTAEIVREHTGRLAMATEQTLQRVKPIRMAFAAMTNDADRFAFIDRMENGLAQPTPEMRAAALQLRSLLDGTRTEVQALGTGKLSQFIENYFPHIWNDPGKAAEIFGRRPLQGSRSFLRQRTIPTTAQGLANGLVPVTTNPVDLALLKTYEMRRYIMAQRIFSDLKDEGLVQFVRSGTEPASQFGGRINDAIATVMGPRRGAVVLPEGANVAASEVGVMGRRVMGEYRAPVPVARILNNYLSPGLTGNTLFDMYRNVGNVLNQTQLGLSAFHLGFTSMEAIVSRNALALGKFASGRPLAALLDVLTSPAAPITNAFRGDRLLRAYLNPEGVGGALGQMVQDVARSGGRVRMDSFYRTNAIQAMRESFRQGEYVMGAMRSIPAALEALSWPVMEYAVPRQKLGVFADLAQFEVSRLPPNATAAETRAVLQRVWDSVDNRMGQLVYDNLFWTRAQKNLGMASVRSLGWNIGTVRELGGGIRDLAAVTNADMAQMTPKAMYAASLPFTVGLYGAAIGYLMTGEGPKELKDYFYPRTGRMNPDGTEERMQMPSYLKDVRGFVTHPYDTVKHKANPLLASVIDMLENEDFYGNEIRNPHDPIVRQLGQLMTYGGNQFTPFAVRNALLASQRKQGAARMGLSFIGITPAPREIVRSDAGNLLAQYSHQGAGSLTPEQAFTQRLESNLRTKLQSRDPDAYRQLAEAVSSGQLNPRQRTAIIKSARTPAAVSQFMRLDVPQAAEVYRVANPAERRTFWPLLVGKAQRALQAGDMQAWAAFRAVKDEDLLRHTPQEPMRNGAVFEPLHP